jgi:hypothetical protein
MSNSRLFTITVSICLLMLVVTSDLMIPLIYTAMHNGFLPWVLIGGLAYFYLYLFIKVAIDLWQEKAYRE